MIGGLSSPKQEVKNVKRENAIGVVESLISNLSMQKGTLGYRFKQEVQSASFDTRQVMPQKDIKNFEVPITDFINRKLRKLGKNKIVEVGQVRAAMNDSSTKEKNDFRELENFISSRL